MTQEHAANNVELNKASERIELLECILISMLKDVVPHVRDTGHNAADREIAEVVRQARKALYLPASETTAAEKEVELTGPADGSIYEGIVTVDVSMSATLRVRAKSVEEARELLCAAGPANYPASFQVDEGNYRDAGSFYLGDEDSVEVVAF